MRKLGSGHGFRASKKGITMPKLAPEVMFERMLAKLMKQRAKLATKIASLTAQAEKIDRIFTCAGLAPASSAAKAARGPKAGRRQRRSRGRFSVTAEQCILDFVRKEGQPSTAQVNAFWKKQGRGGKADNTLSKLASAGQLKRIKAKGVRGSQYAIA